MAQDSQGTPERVCSLSGTREAINRAKELIMNIVHQRGRSEGLGGLDLGPGLGQGNYQGRQKSINICPACACSPGGCPPTHTYTHTPSHVTFLFVTNVFYFKNIVSA